jgi:hypothetical protein
MWLEVLLAKTREKKKKSVEKAEVLLNFVFGGQTTASAHEEKNAFIYFDVKW